MSQINPKKFVRNTTYSVKLPFIVSHSLQQNSREKKSINEQQVKVKIEDWCEAPWQPISLYMWCWCEEILFNYKTNFLSLTYSLNLKECFANHHQPLPTTTNHQPTTNQPPPTTNHHQQPPPLKYFSFKSPIWLWSLISIFLSSVWTIFLVVKFYIIKKMLTFLYLLKFILWICKDEKNLW